MSHWKEIFMSDWHPMRILRLGAGIALLVAAINSSDYLVGALSLLLIYQGVFNAVCCGSSACHIAPHKYDNTRTATAEFEEIKSEQK